MDVLLSMDKMQLQNFQIWPDQNLGRRLRKSPDLGKLTFQYFEEKAAEFMLRSIKLRKVFSLILRKKP